VGLVDLDPSRDERSPGFQEVLGWGPSTERTAAIKASALKGFDRNMVPSGTVPGAGLWRPETTTKPMCDHALCTTRVKVNRPWSPASRRR
jgi:hypothetical protein